MHAVHGGVVRNVSFLSSCKDSSHEEAYTPLSQTLNEEVKAKAATG